MRKKYLLKPNISEKNFVVPDLLKVTDYAEGMVAGQKMKATSLGIAPFYNSSIFIQDMFSVDDKMFARDYEGTLYELRGSIFYKKTTCGFMNAVMGSVILNGKKEFIYIDEKGGQILDNNSVEVGLPYGTYFSTHALRCFVAKDYTVYFSSPFDFNNRSMMLDNCGNFTFTYEDGKVIGLFDFSTHLLIVCTNCFYKLTEVDGEFKLEKIQSDNYNIEKLSLVKVKDKLLFIADKKFYAYKDFSIKQISSIFIEDVLLVNPPVTSNANYYYCQTSNPDKRCMFIYNVDSDESMLVPIGECRLLCKNLLVNEVEQRLYAISPDKNKNSTWKSLAMNLGTNNKKSLLSLVVKVGKDATLKITGDFGSKIFELRAGLNEKTMNLPSREFVLEINCPTSNMTISDLQFKYID